ncbi:MAG: cell envelope integrity protein CreD [Prevotellaceae bacterium]|nr:cell envelope integrity protein CreD [Prevotellaceae bacterium]
MEIKLNALLLGSIGLFVILGAIMYFSQKIKWYSNPTDS